MCKTDQRVSEYEDGPDSEMIAGKSDAGESSGACKRVHQAPESVEWKSGVCDRKIGRDIIDAVNTG